MIGVILALASSLAWGISDFLGGLKSRSMPTPVVLAVSQTIGMLGTAVILIVRGNPMPQDGRLWLAIAAGAAAVLALGLLYYAMTRGSIVVIAPVAAVGAVVPVIVGVVQGEHASALVITGIVLALAGATGASWETSEDGKRSGRIGRAALVAAAAAISIGVFFVLLDEASTADPYWATFITCATGSLISLAVALRPAPRKELGAALRGRTLLALGFIGLADIFAQGLFALASTHGDLGITAVLSSLYPAVTVLLAAVILRERVHWIQICGTATALGGVAVLSAATA